MYTLKRIYTERCVSYIQIKGVRYDHFELTIAGIIVENVARLHLVNNYRWYHVDGRYISEFESFSFSLNIELTYEKLCKVENILLIGKINLMSDILLNDIIGVIKSKVLRI